MARKKKFFIYDTAGIRRKVSPRHRDFKGSIGDARLSEVTVINGYSYYPGDYPFIFWGVPIYDKHGQPIVDDGRSDGENADANPADVDRMLDNVFGDKSASHMPTHEPNHGHHDTSPSHSTGYDNGDGSDGGGDGGGD